jgi:hypothetical protein
MGRVWVCFPHEPKAILNSGLDKFSLSAKVNPVVKTDRTKQKKKGVLMDIRLSKIQVPCNDYLSGHFITK